jgi:hypothetical protein
MTPGSGDISSKYAISPKSKTVMLNSSDNFQ